MFDRILGPLRSWAGVTGASTVKGPYEALTAGWRKPASGPVTRKAWVCVFRLEFPNGSGLSCLRNTCLTLRTLKLTVG